MSIQSLQLPLTSGLLRSHVVEPGALSGGELKYSVELQDARLVGTGIDVDIGIGAKPLPLLMSSLLEHIHQQLRSRAVNVTSIQRVADSRGETPEAAAHQIAEQIAALYKGFQQQHPELDEAVAHGQFSELVVAGLNAGLAETRAVLSGVGALQAGTAERIEQTYELIQQRLSQQHVP